MNQYNMDRQRLQMYLPQLRGCAGLSTEALANKLGITKQAISNLEHQDPIEQPMNKMQYISIRAIFDEEYHKNPDNINLRDCYDLVFSDPEFYKTNEERIKYALYQAVEDTKKQKKNNRLDAKKAGVAPNTISNIAGATAATIAVGGIASAAFPIMFPTIVGAVISGTIVAASKKGKSNNNSNIKSKRATEQICHSPWIREAFEAYYVDEKKHKN